MFGYTAMAWGAWGRHALDQRGGRCMVLQYGPSKGKGPGGN